MRVRALDVPRRKNATGMNTRGKARDKGAEGDHQAHQVGRATYLPPGSVPTLRVIPVDLELYPKSTPDNLGRAEGFRRMSHEP